MGNEQWAVSKQASIKSNSIFSMAISIGTPSSPIYLLHTDRNTFTFTFSLTLLRSCRLQLVFIHIQAFDLNALNSQFDSTILNGAINWLCMFLLGDVTNVDLSHCNIV